MCMCVPKLAEFLFQVVLMRIWISVEAEKIDIVAGVAIQGCSVAVEGKTGAVCIFICVEKDIGPVVFVVTRRCLVQLRTRTY